MNDVQQGEWGSRVLIKDKKNSKSYLVNIDFISEKPDKMRMDIALPMGIDVAAMALNNNQLSYVIMQKHAYYHGPANSKSFAGILNLAIDPKLLMNVLYDEPIEAKGWKCSEKDGFVAECVHSPEAMKITWAHRKLKEKIVTISHHDFEIEMQFHSFSVPKTIKEEIFTINQPNGFHKIN